MQALVYLSPPPSLTQVAEQILVSRQISRQHQLLLTLSLRDFTLTNRELSLIDQIGEALHQGAIQVID